MAKLVLVLWFMVVTTALAADPDLTGTWNLSVNITKQQRVSAVLVLRQDGSRLSGSYRGSLGDGPVEGTATHSRALLRYTQNGTEYLLTGDILSANRVEGSVRIKDAPTGFFHADRAK